MTLRPYQQRAVDFLQGKRRAFVVSPAGSGKTLIAAFAAAAQKPANIIWLANTKEQVEQARMAAHEAGIQIAAHCVAAQPDCSKADLVIVDEAHHAPAQIWSTTIGNARGVVWGFSATPWSPDEERNIKLRSFFEDFIIIPRDEVLAHGSITKGIVVIHDVDQPGEFDAKIHELTTVETIRRCRKFPFIPQEEHERRAKWQATAECVRDNTHRNDSIVHLANTQPGSVLILVGTVEHGDALSARIFDSQIVHAKLSKLVRKSRIDSFRSGALRCLIATSLADEGLDVPRASVLILAAGGRSAAKLEQRAGRVMRPHGDKEFGTVHDFADRGAALAHAQFRARVRTYKKLGYELHQPNKQLAGSSLS